MKIKPPLVTILIPHYKTLALTKLCLQLLRKNTDLDKIKVIVIDNDSQDESTVYLRNQTWIELIERKRMPAETAVQSHSRALDVALTRVTTPFVLSIHTDTFVKHPQWLEFLLAQIERNPNIAGVGSWKLENKVWWRRLMKQLERVGQILYYSICRTKKHAVEGFGKNFYYLRSHCALYRMDLLKKYNLKFSDNNFVAGKAIHKALVEKGYQMIFLPSKILINYLEHVNHATTILNPHLSRQKKLTNAMQRVKLHLERLQNHVTTD